MRSVFGIAVVGALLVLCGSAPGSAAQELMVACTVEVAETGTAEVEFGLVADALVGIDPFDEPLPPPTPDQSLQVYIQMMLPPVPLPNRWRRDVRPFYGITTNRVEIWSMTVECTAIGQEMVVGVDITVDEVLPYTLHILGPDGLQRLVQSGERFAVTCTAQIMTFYWQLQYDEQVPLAPHSWGGMKAVFR